MEKITPRWECCSFGRHFGEEARPAALTPEAVQESDEVCLLSGAGDNVKVRADLMDIKVLREVNADGLEWLGRSAGKDAPSRRRAANRDDCGPPIKRGDGQNWMRSIPCSHQAD